jgi:hypothetical protein
MPRLSINECTGVFGKHLNKNKPNTPSTWIDPDDAPELEAAFFADYFVYAWVKDEQSMRSAGSKSNPDTRLRLDTLLPSP